MANVKALWYGEVCSKELPHIQGSGIGAQMLNISAPQPTRYNSDTTKHYS